MGVMAMISGPGFGPRQWGCVKCGAVDGHLAGCPTLQIATAPQPILPSPPVAATGWLCPACGRGNAPFASFCPCKGYPQYEVTC